MVLDNYRARGAHWLEPLAVRLSPGGADRLTWISLVAAGAAGVCFTWASPTSAWFLVLGAFFVLVNGLFDALDGIVARKTGSASPAGDFLDHGLDRYADLFIIGGLAASAFGGYKWGFFAITGVLLTSYMGTQAAAVGLRRDYGGLLGRADRLVLLSLVPLLQAVFVYGGLPIAFSVPEPFGGAVGVTLIEALLFVFAVFGHLTALQRFSRARFALLQREGRLIRTSLSPTPQPEPSEFAPAGRTGMAEDAVLPQTEIQRGREEVKATMERLEERERQLTSRIADFEAEVASRDKKTKRLAAPKKKR